MSADMLPALTAKRLSEGKSLVNLLAENSGINILPIDIGINGDIEAEAC